MVGWSCPKLPPCAEQAHSTCCCLSTEAGKWEWLQAIQGVLVEASPGAPAAASAARMCAPIHARCRWNTSLLLRSTVNSRKKHGERWWWRKCVASPVQALALPLWSPPRAPPPLLQRRCCTSTPPPLLWVSQHAASGTLRSCQLWGAACCHGALVLHSAAPALTGPSACPAGGCRRS